MDEIPLSPPLPSSPVAPHPRIVPPSLVPVLKANIAYPDVKPQVIRWSRELEELFYLLSWDQWYDLLDDHQADLDILQSGTATQEEEAVAYRRYDVRMNQVLGEWVFETSWGRLTELAGCCVREQRSTTVERATSKRKRSTGSRMRGSRRG